MPDAPRSSAPSPRTRGAAERAALRLYLTAGAILLCLVLGIGLLVRGRTPFDSLVGASHVVLIVLAFTFTGVLIVQLSRELDAAAAAHTDASAAAASARGRLAAQTRTAALVHDEVLSVLRVAGLSGVDQRTTGPAAARALSQLRELAGSPTASFLQDVEHAAQHGAHHGDPPLWDAVLELTSSIAPDAVFEARGAPPSDAVSLPQEVRTALLSAVRQALENSVLHAGAHATRTVTCESAKGSLRITVSDTGVGFDPSEVPAKRLGVRTTIERAVREAGGTAEISSRPGHGTRVTLGWSAPGDTPLTVARNERALRAGVAIIAVAFVVTQVLIAVLATAAADPWWAPLASVGVLFTATEVLRRSPADRPSATRSTAVLALITLAVVIGMVGADYRYGDLWFVMAAALTLTALVFRGSIAMALTGGAVTLGSVAAWGAVAGVSPLTIAFVLYRPALLLALAVLLMHTVGRMQRRTTREHELTAEATRLAAWHASETAEREARASEILDHTEHMLERIASGVTLTAHERGEAHALDGLLRDQLRAGRLAIDAILAAAMRARARGVDVAILDDRDGDLPIDPHLSAMWIAERIDDAHAQATVRLLPAGRSSDLSVVIDGVPLALP